MTLLTIVRDAAIDAGFDPPAIVVGNNTDILAQKMLRAAQRTGLDLVKRSPWGISRIVRTFSAINGETQLGALPADYDRMVPQSFWDRTNQYLVNGPIPAAQWQSLQSAPFTAVGARWFTIRGGQILITPTMNGGENMVFEYVSNAFCASSGGTRQSRWLADSDVPLFSEELFTLGVTYFIQMGENLPWADSFRLYQERIAMEVEADQPSTDILSAGDIFGGRRAWTGSPAPDQSASYSRINDLSGGGLS